MQQREARKIRWIAQRLAAREELRAANRKDFFRAKTRDVQAGCPSVPMTDRNVDILARKVYMLARGVDAQIDGRMRFGEAAEPVNEPFCREVGRGADRQHATTLPLQQPFGPVGDAIEGIANDHKVRFTGLGDYEPLPLAVEELQAKLGFQRFDLMADRTLRDKQLFSRPREAFVPRRGLEGFQRIEHR